MYAFQHIFLLVNFYFISLIGHISDIFSSVSSDNMEGCWWRWICQEIHLKLWKRKG